MALELEDQFTFSEDDAAQILWLLNYIQLLTLQNLTIGRHFEDLGVQELPLLM